MEIGSRWLLEGDIILPHKTSLTFDVEHKNKNGEIIDHSDSTVHMKFQSSDKKTTYDLDSCCAPSAEHIRVAIPASMSSVLPIGKLKWDMIVETALGERIRLIAGKVIIDDTYALDEV